ncbi:MAG: hypothetical protein MZU97_15580 [Bacillus subtilis]|nr:hypothetical protein [Bacillus subtilis]
MIVRRLRPGHHPDVGDRRRSLRRHVRRLRRNRPEDDRLHRRRCLATSPLPPRPTTRTTRYFTRWSVSPERLRDDRRRRSRSRPSTRYDNRLLVIGDRADHVLLRFRSWLGIMLALYLRPEGSASAPVSTRTP